MNPFEGLSRAQIRTVASKARAALAADPTDAEAQEWLDAASNHLRETLSEVGAGVAAGQRRDREAAEPDFSGTGGAIGAAALKAGQGATLGLSDELAGLAAALVPGGRGYREATEGARTALRAAGRQRPLISGVADIAGSLLVPVPKVGSTGKAIRQILRRPAGQRSIFKAAEGARPTLRQLVGQGALVGGVQGGGQAVGRTEGGAGARAKAGAIGVGTGAILGAAIPVGLAGARTGLRQMKNAVGYVVRPVTEPAKLLRVRPDATEEIVASAKRIRDEPLDVPTFRRRAPSKPASDPIAQQMAAHAIDRTDEAGIRAARAMERHTTPSAEVAARKQPSRSFVPKTKAEGTAQRAERAGKLGLDFSGYSDDDLLRRATNIENGLVRADRDTVEGITKELTRRGLTPARAGGGSGRGSLPEV